MLHKYYLTMPNNDNFISGSILLAITIFIDILIHRHRDWKKKVEVVDSHSV